MSQISKPQICLTVFGRTEAELLENLKQAQSLHNFVELRLDYLPSIPLDFLPRLKKEVLGKAIITCRSRQDGGEFAGNDEEQLTILQQANELGFTLVDVDLRLINQLELVEKKSQIIVSYHHFSHTPGYLQLKKILKRMRASRADVYKFACLAQSEKDLRSLYKLLVNQKSDEKLIVLGMGPIGRTSRIVSPLLGGLLTFASLTEATAPGQLSFEELAKAYKALDI
jgi:3-dehydroquinate dehydratase type I